MILADTNILLRLTRSETGEYPLIKAAPAAPAPGTDPSVLRISEPHRVLAGPHLWVLATIALSVILALFERNACLQE